MAESDFSEENPFAPFLGKKGPKRAQNEVFGIFMKIESLVFSEFLHEIRGMGDGFFRKKSLCPFFGQKGPKTGPK